MYQSQHSLSLLIWYIIQYYTPKDDNELHHYCVSTFLKNKLLSLPVHFQTTSLKLFHCFWGLAQSHAMPSVSYLVTSAFLRLFLKSTKVFYFRLPSVRRVRCLCKPLFCLCIGTCKIRKSFWVRINVLPSGRASVPTGCPRSDPWVTGALLKVTLHGICHCAFRALTKGGRYMFLLLGKRFELYELSKIVLLQKTRI